MRKPGTPGLKKFGPIFCLNKTILRKMNFWFFPFLPILVTDNQFAMMPQVAKKWIVDIIKWEKKYFTATMYINMTLSLSSLKYCASCLHVVTWQARAEICLTAPVYSKRGILSERKLKASTYWLTYLLHEHVVIIHKLMKSLVCPNW